MYQSSRVDHGSWIRSWMDLIHGSVHELSVINVCTEIHIFMALEFRCRPASQTSRPGPWRRASARPRWVRILTPKAWRFSDFRPPPWHRWRAARAPNIWTRSSRSWSTRIGSRPAICAYVVQLHVQRSVADIWHHTLMSTLCNIYLFDKINTFWIWVQ